MFPGNRIFKITLIFLHCYFPVGMVCCMWGQSVSTKDKGVISYG